MSRAARVAELVRAVATSGCSCPIHSGAQSCNVLLPNASVGRLYREVSNQGPPEREYAFEMSSSNVRYGPGVTKEVGMDVQNLGIKKLCVFTDQNLSGLPPVKDVLDSLHASNVTYSIFDEVSIEPTSTSLDEAIEYVRKQEFDGFVAIGGGSVMDTAKASNLLSCYPDKELMDFVSAPFGKGEVPMQTLMPLICVPTTAGTGSETSGAIVFDYTDGNHQTKVAFASRAVRPLLGLIDPLHMKYMPKNVAAFSGFDVLCHALESYTALPYQYRMPRPANPIQRPAFQGSNPIADLWSLQALRIIKDYFKRAVMDAEDEEARSAMHLASTWASVGFGNAGVHLCHGMSYPISGNVRSYRAEGYDQKKPLIPHGLSVVISAPAVFNFTAPMCPERHLKAAGILGADIRNAKLEDAGQILGDLLRWYMQEMGVVNGLSEMGYTSADIPDMVQGTLPQESLTKLSPREFSVEQLSKMFQDSLKVY